MSLKTLADSDNYLYYKIKRGLYGLKQAARSSRDQLKKSETIWVYTFEIRPKHMAPQQKTN